MFPYRTTYVNQLLALVLVLTGRSLWLITEVSGKPATLSLYHYVLSHLVILFLTAGTQSWCEQV